MLLNGEAYEVNADRLVYDMSHPLDAANATCTPPENEAGEFRRGEVMDFKDGKFVRHTDGGDAAVIVAETTPYAADDLDVIVPVYVSGTFRESEVISGVSLSSGDREKLRGKNIYLK